MTRTTLDLDPAILRALKQRQKVQHKSLGALASELLAQALASAKDDAAVEATAPWTTQPMNAKVDLEDKEALYTALGQR